MHAGGLAQVDRAVGMLEGDHVYADRQRSNPIATIVADDDLAR
jgi:hypothetical protein